jgi:hypothetical protein
MATAAEEGVLAKPPYIAVTVERAGFDVDRKLM